MNELYADTFGRCYGLETVGCATSTSSARARIPEGAYAAVIPKWIAAMMRGETVYINGDGETARDFCYIENVVQANLLAGTVDDPAAVNQVYNVAVGDSTSLNTLYQDAARPALGARPDFELRAPVYRDFRAGDVRFSRADIGKARSLLGYQPTCRAQEGLERAIEWYVAQLGPTRPVLETAAAA
jgi:UDP-N-acetylglucosamine 4-epimerase